MSNNPLANLKIDYWYKALLVIAAFVLPFSLFVETKGVQNSVVQLLSLGSILIGIGEWINHPLQVRLGLGFKISGHARINKWPGNLCDLAGVIFVLIGVAKVFL